MRGLLLEEVIWLKPEVFKKFRFAEGFAKEWLLGRLNASALNSNFTLS